MEKIIIGSEGQEVLDIQKKLISIGFQKLWYNEKIVELKADGKYGEITREAVESFQAKALDIISLHNIKDKLETFDINYSVTGEVDFFTKYAIMNYETIALLIKAKMEVTPIEELEIPEELQSGEEPEDNEITLPEIRQLLVDIQKAEIGTTEKGGNNYGAKVQEYQTLGSNGAMTGGAAWCQYFQNWSLVQLTKRVNVKYLWTYSGYTPTWVNWGRQKKIAVIKPKLSDIEIGDFGYVYSPSRDNARHVFIIAGKTKGGVITVEGNTNPGGGSDGYGVFKRVRPLGSQVWAVVKWHKLI